MLKELAAQGFARARVDGEIVELADASRARSSPATSSTPSRWSSTGSCAGAGIERRLTDSIETALRLAEGVAEIEIVPPAGDTLLENESEAEVLTFSRAPRVHPLRHLVRGAGAAQLLVQLALRRLPGVRRPRHPVRGRPRARRARTRTCHRRGRDRAVGRVSRTEYFGRVLGRSRRTAGFSIDDAVEAVARPQDKKIVLHGSRRKRHVRYRNRYGRTRSYHTALRGRRSRGSAPPHRGRLGLARASRSRATCARCRAPTCEGTRLKPRVARGHGRRAQHRTRSATCRSASRPRRPAQARAVASATA